MNYVSYVLLHQLFSFLTASVIPALSVPVRSDRLVAGRLGFYSRSGHTKDFKSFKSSTSSFPPGARHYRKCEGPSVCVFFVLYVLGPPIKNGLHNVYLAPAVPYLYRKCPFSFLFGNIVVKNFIELH